MSFHMWRRSLIKHPEPRQITWVFGESVLADEVLSYVRKALKPEPWNYASLDAGEISERKIWAEAEQHPIDSGNHLVVIRHAQELKDLDRFQDWVKQRTLNPRTFLVLISDVDKIPKTEPTRDELKKGIKSEVLPHLKSIGTRGHVIECRAFTNQTAHHSISWVQSKVRMSDVVARHLIERSNFDLRLVRDICLKLAAFPGAATASVIDEMLSGQPRDSFIDALFALDRKGALLALRDIPEDEYSRLIGQIDAQLDLVGLIHDMQATYSTTGEIARAAGKQAYLVPGLMGIAKHYDTKRRHSIRKMLAVCDSAHRGGISTGIFEGLIATW